MKKILLETSFSKIYMIVMILISILVVGGYFSYAMFTVTKEKSNAISIVTGNLNYKLEVDDEEKNTLSIPSNNSKDFIITLSNPNNRIARFNFYYIGNIPSDVEVGYITEEGINIPPVETGINLEKIDTTGSSNTYKIRVTNDSNSSVTITLGASVGLDYNDLSLPSNGNLFEEYSFPTAVEVVKSKSNEESLEYINATEEQRKEAWEHTHPKTMQTEALTDYRYVGKQPNNYVKFNDEIWRIIGVFTVDDGTGKKEERVKIIRNESIGSYSWDITAPNGINNWPDSRINYLLNPGYEELSTGGSLYWNREKGLCYSNPISSCDFTTTGLKEESRNMIGDTLWYIGGTSTYSNTSNGLIKHWYAYERGTTVYGGNDTFWIGKVGLMYPSDYGYATSAGTSVNRLVCLNKDLNHWNELSNCYQNDWLYNKYYQWFMTSLSNTNELVFSLYESGGLGYGYAINAREVHPTVYLKANVKITDGDGSSSNPYVLKL